MKAHFGLVLVWLAGVVPSGAKAGCPCNADVDNNTMINAIDVAKVVDCAEGNCAACVNDCDVNCNGTVDYVDAGVTQCRSQGNLDCCTREDGACTGVSGWPACVMTLETACASFPGGTYHGDNTICYNDAPLGIPAASQWGLLALAISVMIGGTVLLRLRRGLVGQAASYREQQ